jgi:hypothetical protein
MSPKALRKVATILEINETPLIDAWLHENVWGLSLAPKELHKIPVISIVKNTDGEATFKQIKKKGKMWVLHPLNPKYEDIQVDNRQLFVVGVVVEKLKRY